jgi:hypothetical protein
MIFNATFKENGHFEPYRDILNFKILVKHVPAVSIVRSRTQATKFLGKYIHKVLLCSLYAFNL